MILMTHGELVKLTQNVPKFSESPSFWRFIDNFFLDLLKRPQQNHGTAQISAH